MYYFKYDSPLGEMVGTSDGKSLCGLYFVDQKFFSMNIIKDHIEKNDLSVFLKTKEFLDQYFYGKVVKIIDIPISISGTEFQKRVWKIIYNIPYGDTISYSDISDKIYNLTQKKTSPRAVGGAVGHNPISIIIPCHRVMGKSGELTGYAGGIDRKKCLLDIESKHSTRG